MTKIPESKSYSFSKSILRWGVSPAETRFSGTKTIQFISRVCLHPQTSNTFVLLLHLVDSVEGRCQRWMLNMSSAICLIYLVTEYSWALILVSAFSQLCRERPAAASTVIEHAWSFDVHLLQPFPESVFVLHQRLFLNEGWFCLKRTIASRSNLQGGAMLLLPARRSGMSQWKHPAKKRGKRAGITPCSALMPADSPWHLWGHALTSAGISTPSLLSLMRFLSAQRKPHQIPCALQELLGGPVAGSALSRLPWLVWQRRRAAVWGQALLAWQQRLQRLSH